MQSKRKSKFILLPFILLLFISCTVTEANQENLDQTNYPTMTIATIQSASTPISVFEYQGQVTDGSISLSIEPANVACVPIDQPIPIKLIFTNLTTEEITIPADFLIAVNRRGDGGNLIPLLRDANGINLLSLADYQLVDIFSTPSSTVSKISSRKSYETTIDYYFPQELVATKSNEKYQLITPSPGQYFIRFVFSEYRRDDPIWYGTIGSNFTKICIQN
jgi:hypothetical protein